MPLVAHLLLRTKDSTVDWRLPGAAHECLVSKPSSPYTHQDCKSKVEAPSQIHVGNHVCKCLCRLLMPERSQVKAQKPFGYCQRLRAWDDQSVLW
jgi:hypothetical protein